MRTLKHLAIIVAVALAAVGCSSQSDEPETSVQPNEAETSVQSNEPETSVAVDATQVAERLAATGLPITDIATTTEDNDPNDLLGRQGGYISRVTFVLPGGDPDAEKHSTDRGGSIEVRPTDEAAIERSDYVQSFSGSLLGDGYDYVFGPVLLRIAGSVTPSVAEPFEGALREAVAP